MIFYLLFCNILLIPIIICSNITVSDSDKVNKTTLDSQPKKLINETKVPLLSEGGSILPETLALAFPKSNNSITSLANEISRNKVVPRKGVVYVENSTKPQDVIKPSKENSFNQSVTPIANSKAFNEETNNKTNVVNDKSTVLDNISNISKTINNTEIHKKPLILHSDILENMTVKSSLGSLVKDQIQSPNQDVKTYLTNGNNHPGMVMPIVITILLVPMFAVLGYMALRRGQEAWKNRHYKRMDFLLDGMYND